MLGQIAVKAREVMECDRCSVFLHDPGARELWSTVALGLEGRVIRIPRDRGVAGHCFLTGRTINLADAYADARFDRSVDDATGYRTRSLLCTPIHRRDGERLGVVQVLNKAAGAFAADDEELLAIFANHASMFIEIAQLQQTRIDALEQTSRELERLNRVKNKALHHLSHELRTPLAVLKGNLQLLRQRLAAGAPAARTAPLFEALERHLQRLLAIQEETDTIIRAYGELEGGAPGDASGRAEAPASEPIPLRPLAAQVLEAVARQAAHRLLRFELDVPAEHRVAVDAAVLERVLVGLLRNAVENTPDEGTIRLRSERRGARIALLVRDFGIGITEENQKSVFDGLFHTQETDLYSSKRPYDFNAGGKGLDLLKFKAYGRRFGFELSMESRRCAHLPADRDLCPGRISACPHCRTREDCLASGESTFAVSLPSGD
jgi:signal transduction histidine kinase